ncbi:unnamed protein product, partial [Sphacelaria rigidula]
MLAGKGLVVARLLVLLGTVNVLLVEPAEHTDYGKWWKDFLSSGSERSWFDHWNPFLQVKFDELSRLAEEDPDKPPYKVSMVGDSTMRHQFGAMCAYLAEREG